MPRQEIEAIREQLDAGSAGQGNSPQRQYRRWTYEQQPVTVRMTHPGDMVTTLQYACRNLSNGGMSILHSSFVHEGTRCVVLLPHPTKGAIQIQGAVIRCRHCRGKIHEVGIRFDASVDLSEVLSLDSADNSLMLESIKPESLVGSVLVIEESELDRMYLRKCLADTQLNVVAVGSAAEGLARCKETFDLIICDFNLSEMNGLELLQKLRQSNNQTPMIMVSADDSLRTKLPLFESVPDGVVPKPFKPQRLLGALAQFLLADANGSASGGLLYSSLPPTDAAYSLLPTFVGEVAKLSGELQEAVGRGDSAVAKRITFQLKGAAATFGYEVLGKVAERAHTELSAGGTVATCRTSIDNVLGACARVRERKAA